VSPDVDIEDYAVTLPEAPTEGETASFEEAEVVEGEIFDGNSESTGDSSGDELFAEDIVILDEPTIATEIEIIDLPEQPTEEPAVTVEEKPHLPSWLDLLRPLD